MRNRVASLPATARTARVADRLVGADDAAVAKKRRIGAGGDGCRGAVGALAQSGREGL